MVLNIRHLWLFGLSFVASCETVTQSVVEDDSMAFITAGGSYSTKDGLYDEAFPITTAVFIDSHAAVGFDNLGLCGDALSTNAKNVFDFDELREPYESFALERLVAKGVTVEENSEMRLAFHFDVIDVLPSLSGDHEAAYCLVDFDMDLSGDAKFTFDHDESLSLSKRLSLYSAEKLYFVEVSKLRSSIETEIEDRVNLMAPTLAGKIGDSCGYFQDDPEKTCATHYRLLLGIYERKLRCAVDPEQKEIFLGKIDDFVEKLKTLPPEPEYVERFTLNFGDEDADPEACD